LFGNAGLITFLLYYQTKATEMGLFSTLLGNAGVVSAADLEKEFGNLLSDNEKNRNWPLN
jgi:hypothetical protein